MLDSIAVSVNGSSSAVYAPRRAGICRPELAITTETGNLDRARMRAGSACKGPELPRLTNTLGFGSERIRSHHSGFAVGGSMGRSPRNDGSSGDWRSARIPVCPGTAHGPLPCTSRENRAEDRVFRIPVEPCSFHAHGEHSLTAPSPGTAGRTGAEAGSSSAARKALPTGASQRDSNRR